MEYVRVRSDVGRVIRYVVLNDDYDRVGAIEPIEGIDPETQEQRRFWRAIDRNGVDRGTWRTRADGAEALLGV